MKILNWLEDAGLKALWLTPHIMEDVPNTTAGLKERFELLKGKWQGKIELHLAAEYMMDTLFEERLEKLDLLCMENNVVLMETSTMFPPVNFWDTLRATMAAGYRPLLAHPERYMYMEFSEYEKLVNMGVRLQMNIPSLTGYYGETVMKRARKLLSRGMYTCIGSDTHSFRGMNHNYNREVLGSREIKFLIPLCSVTVE